MKKLYFLFAAVLSLLTIGVANAQTVLMSQDFATGIPGTWTNVDNSGGGDWSYYTIPARSGVTFATTSATNGYAIFDADTLGNDGFLENADLITSSINCSGQSTVKLYFEDVFAQYSIGLGVVSVSNNNGSTWTNFYTVGTGMAQNTINGNPAVHDLDISSVAANQANVKIRFRYTGDWDYWWVVDDIFVYAPVAYDAAITNARLSEYTAVPLSHATSYTPSCEVSNLGGSAVTGVSVQTKIYNGANAVVYTATMTQASLAVGASTTLTASSAFTPTSVDLYLAEFIVSINQADGDITNDTAYWGIDVTDSVYARDAYYLTGNTDFLAGPWFGGASTNAEFGNKYRAVTSSQLISATALFGGSYAVGDQVQAALYTMSGGVPGTLVANSNLITIAASDTPVFFFDIPFPAGTMLNANTDYFISVKQFAASANNFALYSATAEFTPNTSFLKIGTGNWMQMDTTIGEQTFMIWANVYSPAVCNISDVSAGTQTACNPTTNQYTQQVTVTYNNPPATGMLSVNGQTFAITSSPQTVTLTGLTSNGSAVNVTANFTANTACIYTENAVFTAPVSCACPPFSITPTINNATCTASNGSASLAVSGVSGALTYTWSPNVSTTNSATNIAGGTYTVTISNGTCDTTYSLTVPTTTTTLNVSVNTTNVSNCASPNGSATAVVSGGTGTYSYAWTPSTYGNGVTLNNIPSGTYTVVATDGNGCTGTGTGSVANTSGVNASIASYSNITCFGANNGSVSVSTSGGTGTINYTWSDGGTNIASRNDLGPGAQSVIVSDGGGCSVTLQFTITEPAQLTAVLASQTNVTCNGDNNGIIDMTVSGGTGTLTNLWSNTTQTSTDITNLGPNSYQLTVTDANGCSTTGPIVTITEPTALSSSLNATDVSCNSTNDGSLTVSASGGTGSYSYTLNGNTQTTNTFSGLSAGTYTVTTTDANGCSSSATEAVAQSDSISLTISSTPESTSGSNDGTATVIANGGSGSYTYVWNDPNGQSTSTATGLAAGTYTVTVSDGNCTSSKSVVVTIGSGINDLTIGNLEVYPNPTNKNVTVSFTTPNITETSINIYNTIGNVLVKENLGKSNSYSKTFDVSNYAAGVYFIEIANQNGTSIHKLTVSK